MGRQLSAEKGFSMFQGSMSLSGLSIMAVVGVCRDLISYSDEYSIKRELTHDDDDDVRLQTKKLGLSN
jgi:hypothetical protein